MKLKLLPIAQSVVAQSTRPSPAQSTSPAAINAPTSRRNSNDNAASSHSLAAQPPSSPAHNPSLTTTFSAQPVLPFNPTSSAQIAPSSFTPPPSLAAPLPKLASPLINLFRFPEPIAPSPRPASSPEELDRYSCCPLFHPNDVAAPITSRFCHLHSPRRRAVVPCTSATNPTPSLQSAVFMPSILAGRRPNLQTAAALSLVPPQAHSALP
ncbi:hypothetical protein M0R45_026466 [Rubus argutus]|uniref:Uncharacterized protein n=1 Tax=Rubus argutus TaxID=59490 RepID=A0AAW1WXI7_RUBAR